MADQSIAAKRLKRLGVLFMILFALFTVSLFLVDVQPIGPMDTSVGYAALNGGFHAWTGVHQPLIKLTGALKYLCIASAACLFAMAVLEGLRRGSLHRIERDYFVLLCLYVGFAVLYLISEVVPINYRPILTEGKLEVSYPSSTTLLGLCLPPAAATMFRRRMKRGFLRGFVMGLLYALTAVLVLGRTFSGIHWLTDILGSLLLSAALLCFFHVGICAVDDKSANKTRT